MSNPQVAIDIVGNNLVNRGASAAERRLDKLGKHAASVGKGLGRIGDRGGLGNIARTFGEIDDAASKAFGNESVFGTLGKRVGAFVKVGGALRDGIGRTSVSLRQAQSVGAGASAQLGETAVEGAAAAEGMEVAAGAAGGLAAAMGPVAVVGTAVVATLGAAAVAGYKFASGWAASTAQMGRFADMIGVASRDLQELQGAAERYGIGKDATNGAISSFAQNVHDARYGRNNEALALMMRLGVKFRKGADGNLDYSAMLADTSDALARQKDPQTRLMIANRLGIAGMLPLLSKGSGTLQAERSDVAKHGVMNSDADVATAEHLNRNAVVIGQMGDRLAQRAKARDAAFFDRRSDSAVGLARDAVDGKLSASVEELGRSVVGRFVPAAQTISQAADKMLAAVGGTARGIVTDARFGTGAAGIAHLIETVGERSKQWQHSSKGAIGVMQLLPDTARAVAKRNGIEFDDHRFRTDAGYNRMLGTLEVGRLWSKFHDPALVAAAYNAGDAVLDAGGYRDRQGRHHESWLKRIGDPRKGEISDADFAERIPFPETRAYVKRVTNADHLPVKVEIAFVNAPPGTRAKVTAGRSGAPAVSHAMAE